MSIENLRRRIDKLLETIGQEMPGQDQAAPRVTVRLPIKDNEPAIARQIRHGAYAIQFYVPEDRLHEVAP